MKIKKEILTIRGGPYPKNQILEHVSKMVKTQGKIIFRESNLFANSLLKGIKLHQNIELVKK